MTVLQTDRFQVGSNGDQLFGTAGIIIADFSVPENAGIDSYYFDCDRVLKLDYFLAHCTQKRLSGISSKRSSLIGFSQDRHFPKSLPFSSL